MTTRRTGVVFAGLAVSAVVAGGAAAPILGGFEVPLAVTGFLAYVMLGRQAMILWRVDDRVFDDAARHGRYVPSPVSPAPFRRRISRIAAVVPFALRNVEKHP